MEEKSTQEAVGTAAQEQGSSSTKPSRTEHREAYGTAKTENLRDSGLWRILLPAAVVIFGLALFVIPLIILGPLLTNSIIALTQNGGEGELLWVWITMIVLVVGTAAVVTWGIWRAMLTQAVNYEKQ